MKKSLVRINPVEAVEHYQKNGSIEGGFRANEIIRAWEKVYKKDNPLIITKASLADAHFLLGAIYEAGRMEGIRQCRSERKNT